VEVERQELRVVVLVDQLLVDLMVVVVKVFHQYLVQSHQQVVVLVEVDNQEHLIHLIEIIQEDLVVQVEELHQDILVVLVDLVLFQEALVIHHQLVLLKDKMVGQLHHMFQQVVIEELLVEVVELVLLVLVHLVVELVQVEQE